MTRLRADRIAGRRRAASAGGRRGSGATLLVLGWGSSLGAIRAAARRVRANGQRVAVAHLRHLNPLPTNTGDVLRRYERVLVPEMNTGQLAHILRAEFLVDVESYCKLEGKPLFASGGRARADGAAVTVDALTAKDFASDQETRWCPGCGDYAVLAAVQKLMLELIPPRRIVFVTDGCAASRTTWTPTGCTASTAARRLLATGLAAARDDLSIWIVTGDGDALSIGGNHLIHALRRNVPVKILLFNNQVYGLTKGQASPTFELGMVTKSTPFGAQDEPFNPARAGARALRRNVRRPHRRPRPLRRHDRHSARGGGAQGHRVRRDLPELPGVQ